MLEPPAQSKTEVGSPHPGLNQGCQGLTRSRQRILGEFTQEFLFLLFAVIRLPAKSKDQ